MKWQSRSVSHNRLECQFRVNGELAIDGAGWCSKLGPSGCCSVRTSLAQLCCFALCLDLSHQSGMPCPCRLFLRGLTVEFGVLVEAFFIGGLFLFDHQWMGLGISVLPHGGDLPGNLDPRRVGGDLELLVRDFFRDPGVGVASDGSELVAKVGV